MSKDRTLFRGSKETLNRIIAAHSEGLPDCKIAEILKLSTKTVRMYRNELKLIANKRRGKPIKMVSPDTAECSKCLNVKHISLFPLRRRSKYPYRLSYCLNCRSTQINKSKNKSLEANLKSRLNYSRQKSRKHSTPFSLTYEDLLDRWLIQEGKCFYTDVLLYTEYDTGSKPTSASIDRIDPNKGYVKGNFVFCCWRINTIKHNMTLDEMRKWTPDWYRRIISLKECSYV